MVKPAPRFATILCRWLGRLAMPIGEALSAAAEAILGRVHGIYVKRGGYRSRRVVGGEMERIGKQTEAMQVRGRLQ